MVTARLKAVRETAPQPQVVHPVLAHLVQLEGRHFDIANPPGKGFRRLMQQHIRRRSQQQELPRAKPLAASHVDLATEGLEQVRHLLNLIQDHETASLFIQIQIGLCQHLAIRIAFQVDGRTFPRYLKCKGSLADLPGSQKDNSCLGIKSR